MPPADAPPQTPTGPRAAGGMGAGAAAGMLAAAPTMAILVVDLVDSVGLMRRHEAATVRRWAACVRLARERVLPSTGGELVKSLGDGLMARFARVAEALAAARALHGHLAEGDAGQPQDARMMLRAGIHVSGAWTDGLDLYGAGVNMAARLATLAGPGETVLSAGARDELAEDLEVDCEDLGNCYIKSFSDGLRAFRAGAPGPAPLVPARGDFDAPMQPTLAVIPFSARGPQPDFAAVGDLIADAAIDRLSHSPSIRVISRLSTARLSRRPHRAGGEPPPLSVLAEGAARLGASYVLSGAYLVIGTRLQMSAELAEVRGHRLVWSQRLAVPLDDLLSPRSELADSIASAAHRAIFDTEMRRVATQPLPTLQSYSLLLGSINLMHRSSREDFERTRLLLEQLIDRHARIAAPRAWLATWYVLRVTRGLADGHERERDAAMALALARAALDCDPSDAVAIAIEGFVRCHLLRDLASARERCERAVAINPNAALAWLYLGAVHAFEGEGTAAIEATSRALELSPVDPQRYYFESLAATAHLAAGDHAGAEALARASLRLNRLHSSTWRVLAIALVEQDRAGEARDALRELRRLEPGLTRATYLARMPNADRPTGQAWARALSLAGLPD